MKNNRRNRETSIEDAQLYDKVTQLETNIMDKLSHLRKTNKNCLCSHFMELPDTQQRYDPSENYYAKFWRLFLTTQLCRHKIERLSVQINQWENEISNIEEMFQKLQQIRDNGNLGRKKSRRKACEIQKQFSCNHQGCYKIYGTQLALKLHVRQKHSEIQINYNDDE